MPATVGGIIEQRDFGISISLDGNNINDLELNSSNELQLKADGTLLKDTGEWISKVIDIGDKFESYGKVFSTHVDNNGSVITIQTRTSSNGNIWEDWKAVGLDGSILSTKQQFIQIKLVFHAGYDNQVADLNSSFNSEYIDTTNGIKVNRDYVRTMIKDSGYTDEGSLHKITIDKSEFTKVDSVNVPQVASEINKSLILHGGEYKKWVDFIIEKYTEEGEVFNSVSGTLISGDSNTVHTSLANKTFRSNTVSTSVANKAYFGIQLKEAYILKRIIFKQGTTEYTSVPTISVQASNNGSTWTTIATSSTLSRNGSLNTINISDTTKNLYYRVLATANASTVGHNGTAVWVVDSINFYCDIEKTRHIDVNDWSVEQIQSIKEMGMDSLSPLLNRKETELEPVILESKSGILQGDEEGKTFSTIIDLNRLIDIKEIKVEVE